MNNEKVKEIKKVLEQNTKTCLLYDFEKNTDCKVFQCKYILDYINELESELEKEQINNLNCDTELQYAENRIIELEKQKANYLKQFAEKVKDRLEEYRLEYEYFTPNEPNGNLWQLNASVFCIDVTQDGGLIDEILKESKMKEINKASVLRWLDAHINDETAKIELDTISYLKRLVNGDNDLTKPIENNWEYYFGFIWGIYPKKVNKEKAKQTFQKKMRGLTEEETKIKAGKIYKMLERQLAVWSAENDGDGRRHEFIPYFTTWLNGNVGEK